MTEGPISYKNGANDLELALKVDHFPFAMEVNQKDGELIARTVNKKEKSASGIG